MSSLNINTKSSEVDDMRRTAPLGVLLLLDGCAGDGTECAEVDGGLYATGGGVVGFKGCSDLVVGVVACGELAGFACDGLCPAVHSYMLIVNT